MWGTAIQTLYPSAVRLDCGLKSKTRTLANKGGTSYIAHVKKKVKKVLNQ
jgi:hypothetical protein